MTEEGQSQAGSAEPLHVTITGDLGSGKSTVADLVARRLHTKAVSTGDIQRSIAESLSLSTLETNILAERDRAIDEQVDGFSTKLAAESGQPLVFDSRMAWHFVPVSLRVRLIVDPETAVERIAGRAHTASEAYSSAADVRHKIRARQESEVRRFMARYGVDISSLRHFDLVIDTTSLSPDSTAEFIIHAYSSCSAQQHPSTRVSPRTLLVDPRRLLPAHTLGLVPPAHSLPSVVYSRPFFAAVSGADPIRDALSAGLGVMEVVLLAEGTQQLRPGLSAEDLASALRETEVASWEESLPVDYATFHHWDDSAWNE